MLADFVNFEECWQILSGNVLADCAPFGQILANFPTIFPNLNFGRRGAIRAVGGGFGAAADNIGSLHTGRGEGKQ